MSEESKRMITLISSDKETFSVEESVIAESVTIKHMIEDGCADTAIPLANVSGPILAKVIMFCRKHAGAEDKDRAALKSWDAEFVNVDQATLFDIILAANFLNVKALLDVTCQAVADMIKDKSPEEVRCLFNIVNDFTPEEEEQVRRDNQWAFE